MGTEPRVHRRAHALEAHELGLRLADGIDMAGTRHARILQAVRHLVGVRRTSWTIFAAGAQRGAAAVIWWLGKQA